MRFSTLITNLVAAYSIQVLATNPPACTAGTQTVNSRKCTLTCGVDHPGGDYGNKYTGNFQGCVNACAADSKCVTAQYHESNGYCYFKNAVNPTKNVAGTDSVVCGAAPPPCAPVCKTSADQDKSCNNGAGRCGTGFSDGKEYCVPESDAEACSDGCPFGDCPAFKPYCVKVNSCADPTCVSALITECPNPASKRSLFFVS